MQNPLASLRVPDKSPSCPRGGINGGWKGSNHLREDAESISIRLRKLNPFSL